MGREDFGGEDQAVQNEVRAVFHNERGAIIVERAGNAKVAQHRPSVLCHEHVVLLQVEVHHAMVSQELAYLQQVHRKTMQEWIRRWQWDVPGKRLEGAGVTIHEEELGRGRLAPSLHQGLVLGEHLPGEET
jgi:hypothetical protein